MIKTTLFFGFILGICSARGVGPAADNPFTRQDDNKLDEKPRFGSAGGASPAPGSAPAAPAPPPPPPVPVTQAPPPPMMPATNSPPPAPIPAAVPVPMPVALPILPALPPLVPPAPIRMCDGIVGECKMEGELCDPGTARSDDYCPKDDEYCCASVTFY